MYLCYMIILGIDHIIFEDLSNPHQTNPHCRLLERSGEESGIEQQPNYSETGVPSILSSKV